MGTSGADVQFFPEILENTLKGSFANATAFMDSPLASEGVVIVKDTMPAFGPKSIGTSITVPRFNSLGDFQRAGGASNDGTGKLSDGTTDIPTRTLGVRGDEKANIERGVLSFQVTDWSASSPAGDPYQEAVDSVMPAATRLMDEAIVEAACASDLPTGMIEDVYDAAAPRYLDYDVFVDAKMRFEDKQDGVVGVVVHSKTLARLWKLTDANGRPLLIDSMSGDNKLPRLHGLAIVSSDRLPVTATIAATLTASNGSGSAISTSGPAGAGSAAPDRHVDLRIECMKAGARGTSTIRWSTNGGKSWVQDGTIVKYVTTTSGYVDIVDTMGRYTGITIAFSSATNAVADTWTATTVSKFTSLIVKKGSLAFWYNRARLAVDSVRVPKLNATEAAAHVYFAAHRYNQCGGTELPGVVKIRHN